MTHDFNEYYGVTLYPNTKEKIGSRRYRAKAVIFRRDNSEAIETFFAEGSVITTIFKMLLIRLIEKLGVEYLIIGENNF